PAEHPVQDLDVGKQVGHDLSAGVALDGVKEDRDGAVEVLLDTRQLEVRVDLDVRLEHQALLTQPRQAGADRAQHLGLGSRARDSLSEWAGYVERHALPPGPRGSQGTNIRPMERVCHAAGWVSRRSAVAVDGGVVAEQLKEPVPRADQLHVAA